MLLSVVIPCHNGVADTRACLDTLHAQRHAPPFEVVLVDNGSSDGTAELAKGAAPDACGSAGTTPFPIRLVRHEQNLGFAAGVNRGLHAARGDLLLVLNNDTLAAPHLLQRLTGALLADSRVGIAAPVSNHVKGAARLDVGPIGTDPLARSTLEERLTLACGGIVEDTDTLSGLCMLLRRGLVQRIGGFDERFGLGNYEDDDFSLRARLQGARLVIVRDAFLHHHGHRTFRALGVDYRATVMDRQRVYHRKWNGDPAAAALAAAEEGALPRAAHLAGRALAIHPCWPDGHWILARAAAASGDAAAALRHLEPFLAACPRHPAANLLRAFQLLVLGESAAGAAAFAFALQSCHLATPLAVDALARYAQWCLQHDELERAAAHAALALRLSPDDAALLNLLGVVHMQLGRYADAEAALEAALHRGNVEALGNLGICHWRSGRPDAALATLLRAVRARPEDRSVRVNLDAALAAVQRSGADVSRARAALAALDASPGLD